MNSQMQRLEAKILDSDNMVVFTGAGMSTESGIPDFRGPSGIWKRYPPVQLQDFLASRDSRAEYWRRKLELYPDFKNARPNKGHIALAELFNLGFLQYIVTQNIDGLHQEAGIPDERVIELHGTGRFISCLKCGKRFEWEDILSYFNADGTLEPEKDTPQCDYCQGFLKPATISFGQAMPEKETAEAYIRAAESDLFIAVGSSLQVYPAASIPQEASKSGSFFVIINNESTPLDPLADLVIHDQAGNILDSICSAIKNTPSP